MNLFSRKQNTSAGFTVVELMVAMTIFTVLMTMGTGAVLAAMQQQKASQNLRTAMDNLNFIMEDMSRNIRLGSNFHCQTAGEATFSSGTTVAPQNCAGSSNQIAFNDLNGNPIIFTITRPDASTPNQIVKQTTVTTDNLTPSAVQMDYFRSGFTVRGAEANDGQPSVIIRLAGTVRYQNIRSTFALETMVSPRALDPNN